MAKLEEYAYGTTEDWEQRDGEDYMDFWKRTSAQLDELRKRGNEAPTLKGYVWSWGVADGAAHYIVTKVRPLTMAYIQIDDDYTVPEAHIRGLTAKDLQASKDWESAWAGLPNSLFIGIYLNGKVEFTFDVGFHRVVHYRHG